VTLVLASAGYPESASKGDVITGLERVKAHFPGIREGFSPASIKRSR
jgi:phosphoribosylamine-glycine ligase